MYEFVHDDDIVNFESLLLTPDVLRRPPNRRHTVSQPFSRTHGRFLISHSFTNFERIFSQTQFSKKNKHKQNIPVLIKNAFLV